MPLVVFVDTFTSIQFKVCVRAASAAPAFPPARRRRTKRGAMLATEAGLAVRELPKLGFCNLMRHFIDCCSALHRQQRALYMYK